MKLFMVSLLLLSVQIAWASGSVHCFRPTEFEGSWDKITSIRIDNKNFSGQEVTFYYHGDVIMWEKIHGIVLNNNNYTPSHKPLLVNKDLVTAVCIETVGIEKQNGDSFNYFQQMIESEKFEIL